MSTENDPLYLLRIGEMSLKGANKGYFEKRFKESIRKRLSGTESRLTSASDRFYLSVPASVEEKAVEVLRTTFGLVEFHKTEAVEKTFEAIAEAVLKKAEESLTLGQTFRLDVRRSDKSFPLKSMELAARLGGVVLDQWPTLKVKMEGMDWAIRVEVRDRAYVFGKGQRGPGGMPSGCAGKGLVLLSGGIDSPVAAYQMAKRGLRLESVTFPTYPYTSEQSLEKVKKLALLLAPWNLGMRIHSVPFTDVSMHIKKNAPDEAMTLLLRASMMRASEILAHKRDAKCLVTGESLSQVASQTVESMAFTGSVVHLPVFRPLISMDKSEIVEIAKKIGTYETSILPHEDCCTVFAPNRPMINPDLEEITVLYKNLDIEKLLFESVEKTESVWFSHQDDR